MEQQIQNNLEQWMQQWLAIEHPKDITLTKKMEEYRKWKEVWDLWYFSPNLDMRQAILATNEKG